MDRENKPDDCNASAERVWRDFLALVGELPAPVRAAFLLRLLSVASDAEIADWIDPKTNAGRRTFEQALRHFNEVLKASDLPGARR